MTLSEREREVLALLGAGHTNREIGARLVLTSGGHRRFTPDAVRRLAAERGPQPTVEPLPPPDEALPRLAERLCADGPTLRERVTASLYRNGTWGWLAGGDATPLVDAWIAATADGADRGRFDGALEAMDALIRRADLNGATLLERHGFLERFGEATVRAMGREGCLHAECAGARRVFVSFQQSLLAAA